jgi:putative secretion ATPase (PEP-CTERM system associated)
MYCEFYGLKERPFNLTPDTDFLYPSRAHKEVLTHLLYGINSRRGFILVTGEVGAGKTTLCRVLLGQLDEHTRVAFVLNSFLTEFELLRSINHDLGLPTKGRTKMDLLDDLNTYLLEENRRGNNVVIIIDEAQNLSFGVLEQIRMLSNLETEKEKLLQIVLVGQPELKAKLASKRLRQLSQRITVRYHLTPLTREDMRNYIYYRLQVAGSRGDIVFTASALDEIYYLSGGVPRLINGLCDRALMVGYVRGAHRITRAMICRAGTEATGRRHPAAAFNSFLSTRFSMPRVAMATLLGIPFVGVAVLGAMYSTLPRVAEATRSPGRIQVAIRPPIGPPAIAPEASANDTALNPGTAVEPLVPDASSSTDEGPAPDTPDATDDTAATGSSSIARLIRDEGSGSALGSPLGSVRVTEPLRTTYSTPDIDFTPPARNYTPATVIASSYTSLVEPLVQLLLHWGVEPAVTTRVRRDWLGRSEIDLGQIAGTCDVGAVRVACSFDALLAYDLPAVIEVRDDGSDTRYIVLFSIKNDTATIYIKRKQVVIPLETVRELYAGAATFVTSDTFVNRAPLNGEGGLSLDVRKLQDYLRGLKYLGESPTGWYTADTRAAVLHFQTDHAIKPTGIADGQTKLLLYALAPPDGIPRLRR